MTSEGISKNLPQHGLVAITWAGVALAAVFLAGRTITRIWKLQRLRTDDFFLYAAFIVLTINAILQTLQTPYLYYVTAAEAGLVQSDEVLLQRGNVYVRYEFVIIALFWTVLWLVKASFLAFFYHLFEGLKIYRILWWCTVVFLCLAYLGCWLASILNCHPASDYFRFGHCNKPIDLRGSVIAISYSTTVDVLTDVMIMVMPMALLWKVQISRKEKIGLGIVFSVGAIIMVIAIIRAVQITYTARTDSVLLSLWGVLESSVSVVVGCLPAYKALFTKRGPTSSNYLSQSANGYKKSGTGQSPSAYSLTPITNRTTTKVKSGPWVDRNGSSEEIIEQYGSAETSRDIVVKKELSTSSTRVSGSESASWRASDVEHTSWLSGGSVHEVKM